MSRQFHGSMSLEVEFTITEHDKGSPVGKDKSGQPIDPAEGPSWDLDGFTVHIEDIKSYEDANVCYEEVTEVVMRHIDDNYQEITGD